MNFSAFIDAAAKVLSTVGGVIIQRREADPGAGCWWITFRRKAVLHRMRFDRGVASIFFEREQGSFVANSGSTWVLLDCREPTDLTPETALEVMAAMLERRWINPPAPEPEMPKLPD